MKKVTIISILVLLFLSGCKPKTVQVAAEEATNIRTTLVRIDSLSLPLHSSGILSPDQEVKLSFKTGGIIAKIPVSEGELVKKGDLLASLNLSEIDAQVNQAENGYYKALRDFTRAQNLFKDSVATLEQLQNSSTALNVAKSNLEVAQYNLAYSEIKAPDNGVILKQLCKTNELVGSGYPVFLFGVSGKNWKIKAGYADKEIVKVNTGDSAKVLFDAWPEIAFSGVVIRVGKMSNPLTGTYEAEISIKDAGYRFSSGFVAGVDIYPFKKESFLIVPIQSLVEADGRTGYVYAVTGESRVKKIKVEILTLIGPSAAVRGDITGLSEIVSDGAAYLRDGVKVEVVK